MELVIFPFLFGILAFLSPCILPMLQVYLSLVTGSTITELTTRHPDAHLRSRVLGRTACFILGFSVVFVLAGMFAGTIGSFLQEKTVVLNYVGGVIIVLLGLKMLGVFEMKFLSTLHLNPERLPLLTKDSVASAFLVGLFFAIACSHCFGPLLYSTLIVAANTQSAVSGLVILLSFSAGLAIPYFITAVALPGVLGMLRRFRAATTVVMRASGAFLVVFGVLVFFNQFQVLATLFSKIVPWGNPLVI